MPAVVMPLCRTRSIGNFGIEKHIKESINFYSQLMNMYDTFVTVLLLLVWPNNYYEININYLENGRMRIYLP